MSIYGNPVMMGGSGGGGGGDVPLLTRAQWDALSTAQKRAYSLIAVQDSNSGFDRGKLYYGADYVGSLLTASTPSSILAEALCENYDASIASWDNLSLVTTASKDNDGAVVLGTGNCAYYDLGAANTQCTVYAVLKQINTVSYNSTAIGFTYALSAGNSPNFFSYSNTMNLYTSLYGSDTSTGYSLSNYLMLAMRVGANKQISYFVNNAYTADKTANNSGQVVAFSAAKSDLTNSIPVNAKYLAVVSGAETDAVISANMQSIMAHYGIS